MQIRRNSGFTLLEVLITVAVLSILVALAVPSFRAMLISGVRADGRSGVPC